MGYPIDRNSWSISSRRSKGGLYDWAATEYEPIAYTCRACGVSCVYSPEAQKHDFEVLKRYIWRKPMLCVHCVSRRDLLWVQIREIQEQWKQNKAELASQAEFLEGWRSKLKEIASFGRKGTNSSHLVMINKLLDSLLVQGDS